MNLQHVFTIRAVLDAPLDIGAAPLGHRIYYGITGGRLQGDRVAGEVLGGGEWAVLGPDGYLRVDVRLQVLTDDGAALYFQYLGLLEMNEAVQAAIAGGSATAFEDQHFYTQPRVETGDERYRWMNTTFFIGEGRAVEGPGVEYRVYTPA
jgi:hypothetical protein